MPEFLPARFLIVHEMYLSFVASPHILDETNLILF